MYSSIMTADSRIEDGFTTLRPAMFGAVPCVASKMACPVRKLMLAPGAMPIPPTMAANWSEI